MKRKTLDEFKQEVFNLVGNEYTVISKEYINTKTKIQIKHNKCNNIYEVRPRKFIEGNRCPYCVIKTGGKCKSYNKFISDVFNLVGNEYTVISNEYIDKKTKIQIKHNKCNNIYEVKPENFLNKNRRCPYCATKKVGNKLRKTQYEFENEVKLLGNNEYKVLSEYKGTNIKIKLLHLKCNKEYWVQPNYFITGKRCPYCKESKGEKRILEYLDKNNINYKTQYSFNDCKYKNKLKFDFYLEDYNLCIEYDGIQHYKEINFGSENDQINQFKLTQLRDNIKNNYCKDNNIKLLRIPYNDYNNIEYILNKELNLYY